MFTLLWSRGNAVGIATGYGLDDRGIGVRVLVGSRTFFFPQRPNRLWRPTQPSIQRVLGLIYWG
jgi:hypothetical protein